MRPGIEAPAGLLLALAALLPIGVAVARTVGGTRLRAELGLAAPHRRAALAAPLALAATFLLVGVAAARPVLRSGRVGTVRTDAQLLLVVDNSRSMLASARPGSTPRIARALAFATRLHAQLRDVPTGVAALSNRVLPYTFPTPDARLVDDVLAHSVRVGSPGPSTGEAADMLGTPGKVAQVATSFDALEQTATAAFFGPRARRRALVVLTDTEGSFAEASTVVAELRGAHINPVFVRFGTIGDRVFAADGRPLDYVPSEADVAQTNSSGIETFAENDLDGVLWHVRDALGTGPHAQEELDRRTTRLAPFFALAALLPLLLLLAPGGVPALRTGAKGA